MFMILNPVLILEFYTSLSLYVWNWTVNAKCIPNDIMKQTIAIYCKDEKVLFIFALASRTAVERAWSVTRPDRHAEDAEGGRVRVRYHPVRDHRAAGAVRRHRAITTRCVLEIHLGRLLYQIHFYLPQIPHLSTHFIYLFFFIFYISSSSLLFLVCHFTLHNINPLATFDVIRYNMQRGN